mgnify:CR=1 FL=1
MTTHQPNILARSTTIWEADNDGLRGAKRELHGYREISRVLIPRGGHSPKHAPAVADLSASQVMPSV